MLVPAPNDSPQVERRRVRWSDKGIFLLERKAPAYRCKDLTVT
jgi:hypothetical protein